MAVWGEVIEEKMLRYRIGAVVWLCLGAFLMIAGLRGWDVFILKSCFRGYKYSEIVNRIALIFFGFMSILLGLDLLSNW